MLVLLVVACSGMVATSPSQKLAAGYTTVKTIAESTDQLYLNKQIKKADAQNIKTSNDAALVGLDTVKAMQASGDANADAKLYAVIAGLQALQDYLNKAKVLTPAPAASGVK